MKKFFLFICLFFTYQCEDVLPFLQEDTVLGCTNQDALNYNADATEDDGSCTYTDLSISFNSTEPTHLMPGLDLIVNYSISNPSDNEIPSNLLWVDLMWDSSGTYIFMPEGFYSYIYNQEFTVQPGSTNLTDTLVFDEWLIPTNTWDYALYLDIKYDNDTDRSNNFKYIPIEAHMGETVFIDHFNTIDQPLSDYSNKWAYSSNDFEYINVSSERIEIKSNEITGDYRIWDYVLTDTKLTEKIEFDANLGLITLNDELSSFGIFLADWNTKLIYNLLLIVRSSGIIESTIWIFDADEGIWDENAIFTDDTFSFDLQNNKFEFEYDGYYLYGYIDGLIIAKIPISNFECQGYGIMVSAGINIWADDVGVYGNEVESELDLSRRNFSLKGSINPLNFK